MRCWDVMSRNGPKATELLESVALQGLTLAPPQVLGGVRLVPLLRDQVRDDLRLARRKYGEDLSVVQVDKKSLYYAYVPHALVATWSSDGSPAVAFGTQIKSHKRPRTTDGKAYDLGFMTARVMTKMRSREDKNRLRFLPMDLSMEGFLALHFGGPNIAWEEYSRAALRDGLSPRVETTVPGRWVKGLEDALRVFEIHPTQVGSLVFVGDTLGAVFVVPHPDDYHELHKTLVTDSYGELIYYYGLCSQERAYHPEPIDADVIHSVADLRAEVLRVRSDWSDLHTIMTANLFGRPIRAEKVYKMGSFQMLRFLTDLDPKSENHIGEAIVRGDGTLEYMKSFRLSAGQCRRAYLLMQLADSNWELEACGEKLNCTKNQLVYRLEKAGFGYLLHQHVLDAARSERRKR